MKLLTEVKELLMKVTKEFSETETNDEQEDSPPFGLLSDADIIKLCTGENPPMISPFVGSSIKESIGTYNGAIKTLPLISYGLSSFGYDFRIQHSIEMFVPGAHVVDPKRPETSRTVPLEIETDEDGVHSYLLPPNSYFLAPTVETFNIPKDVMGICMGKSTYARCFSGETRVALVDGTQPNFYELIERSASGERLWTYAIDANNRIQVAELVQPRKIATEEVIEVELDNGEVIEATPDHKFILLDGSEVEAQDLTAGTSLMPLYRVETRGYEAVIQPMSWSYTSTHFLADAWNLRHGVYNNDTQEVIHRHHIDHDRTNNRPSNITRVDASTHISQHNRARMDDPVWFEGWKEKITEGQRVANQDPVKFEALKQRGRDGAHVLWNAPEHEASREKILTQLRGYWEGDSGAEARAKQAEIMRMRTADAKFAADHLERLNLMWQDEDFRAMMAAQCATINIREDITEDNVREALTTEGSIRGTARKLNCDRSVFRRFSEVICEFKEKWKTASITSAQFLTMLREYGSVTAACKAIGIGRKYATNHFKQEIEHFYNAPVAENHKVVSVRRTGKVTDVYCASVPEYGNFALAAGVFVKNCAVFVNVTPLEPGWTGELVVEIFNPLQVPVRLYPDEGVGQIFFMRSQNAPANPYNARSGKYQYQTGIVKAKVS